MGWPLSPDPSLALEFRARPLGHHSPELQRLLRVFRTLPTEGKHGLLRVDHRREWVLCRFSGRKGVPLEVDRSRRFADWNEAEWEVFKIRWREVFGTPVPEGIG